MTDNGSPADANAASDPAEEFPTKLRVHALARLLGLTSRQILTHLSELGHEMRSPQSSIDRDVARSVADRVRSSVEAEDASGVEADVPAEDPAQQAPEPAPEPEQAPAETAASEPAPMTLFSAAGADRHEPIAAATAESAAEAGPLFLQPKVGESTPRAGGAHRAKIDAVAAAPAETSSTAETSTAETSTAETTTTAGEPATGGDDTATDNDGDSSESADDSAGDSRNSRRRRRGRRGRGRGRGDQNGDASGDDDSDEQASGESTTDEGEDSDAAEDAARPSGKRGKKRRPRKNVEDGAADDDATTDDDETDTAEDAESDDSSDDDGSDDSSDQSSTKRRRRRRRRKGGGADEDTSPDDPPNTVVHEREPRSKRARDEVQGISGSTRLEAKRQRRRDGRDAGRRRPPILSESEFLARREAVDRVMVVRERSANSKIAVEKAERAHDADHVTVEDYTQVAVLEDGVLVEHFVTTETSQSMVGNIYLGRVQNVLPGMEAAFVDIGRGRNGVLYAGEVNWDAAGLDGGSRKIEQALKPGDNVLVQVSKDPVGHKGARLTTQVSLAGRYLVYVPGGSSTGISRKLPDVERKRLKQILGKIVPADAGVIIRTASEGVSAEDLGADVQRLEKQWESIDAAVTQAKKGSGTASPRALYEEPDLLVRVVRDLFNEDFKKLVVEGPKAWDLIEGYVKEVAPDLLERVEQFERRSVEAPDSFVVHRIDEQLAKALDRKVWLPSGGTLIIEHTEAMTVVDVNTGKFTGSGGNLEETVTRNNLEAAEEIVRQMRLRDIGGMIIVDFIDMVLESNRDLVLRRLTEALARDRTRHQVSEVTSLGLVQMTRKRLGTGLLEAFSTTCTTCGGRGIIVHENPIEVRPDDVGRSDNSGSKRSRRSRRKGEDSGGSGGGNGNGNGGGGGEAKQTHKPAEHPMFRAMAAHTHDDELVEDGGVPDGTAAEESVIAADQPEIETTEPKVETTEPNVKTTEPKVETTGPETAASGAATTESAGDEPAPSAPKRHRRAVRRTSSPTSTSEPIVLTASAEAAAPLTTSGPVATSSEPAVAVRRRPRRRTAGRPAGPPVED